MCQYVQVLLCTYYQNNMPELPEVQTVVGDLEEVLRGETLKSLEVNDEKVWYESNLPISNFQDVLIRDVFRHGKYIVIKTEKGDLLIHLRMTGKVLPSGHASIPKRLIDSGSKQIRAVLKTSIGELMFYDTRRFGTITGVTDASVIFSRKNLAPEIYNEGGLELAKIHFVSKSKRSSRKVKGMLLDQTVILGPGNIYADEALHISKMHPETISSQISKGDLSMLFKNIVEVMNQAISKRGTTAKDYLDFNGNPGVFKKYLKVYKRVGDLCKTCKKEPIKRIKVSGRSSHYCPNCQRI